MPKLTWDNTGERFYEAGTDHGVLFVMTNGTYGAGVAWNGLTAVTQSPEGAEANDMYADNIKYASARSAEDFKGTIEAYTYPDEFMECDGSALLDSDIPGVYVSQQPRKTFAFSYRTQIGSDTAPLGGGPYKIHIVYGATVSPSERAYETINDSPEGMTLSWEFETIPIPAGEGLKPTAHIEIDSRKFTTTAQQEKLQDLEDWLYGTDGEGSATGTTSALPLPAKVIELLS